MDNTKKGAGKALKHTSGEWTACEPGDYADFDGHSIVILAEDNTRRIVVVQGDDEEARANARLIVASQRLLEALREARDEIRSERASLFDCAVSPETGKIPLTDPISIAGIADLDTLLVRLDGAVIAATGSAA